MKLSQMNTPQLAACLCRIAQPIEKLGSNPRVHELLRDYGEREKGEGAPMLTRLSMLIGTLIPALLGDDTLPYTVEILSALTGKPVREIMEQPGMQTVRDAYSVFDDELIGFFTQSANTAQ